MSALVFLLFILIAAVLVELAPLVLALVATGAILLLTALVGRPR